MKLSPYWLDIGVSEQRFTNAITDSTDVLVIGGGLTGLSASLTLASKGTNVTLIEAGEIAGEASGRNGGQCNNGTLQDYGSLVKLYGESKAREFYLAYNSAVDNIEQLVRELEIECDFRRNGKLKLASKPGHVERLKRTLDVLQTSGVDPDTKLLSKSDLEQEIQSDVYFAGLLQPLSATLHVGKFCKGLANVAEQKGASICEFTQAQKIVKVENGWLVNTNRGMIRTKSILMATGGSGSTPVHWFKRRVIPVGSFVIVTEPLSESTAKALLPEARSYVNTLNIGNYFRLTSDHRLLFGGRAKFAVSNPKSDHQSATILTKTMATTFPQLKGVGVDYCWGGSVDMSADRMPKLGQRNGIYYAMGYSGHGVQMAVQSGQEIAKHMLGEQTSSPWLNAPWKAIPAYTGKPWFLPFVGWYYQFMDKVD
jgi:glycine/D-amino acid oxidase-like deaminating enzyme